MRDGLRKDRCCLLLVMALLALHASASPAWADSGALLQSFRGSISPLLNPATPPVLAMRKDAVRPMLEMLWTKPHGNEFELLLYLLNPHEVLEVLLQVMADYDEDPELRMKAGAFARGFAGTDAIQDELTDLYKDVYKDPATPHQVRTRAGNLLDSLNRGRPDDRAQFSIEYRFREPGTPSPGGLPAYFLGKSSFAIMLTTLTRPGAVVIDELTGFLTRIEILRTSGSFTNPQTGTALAGAAKHASPRVRAAAAALLPYLDDPARVSTLSSLAEDEDPVVRAESLRGLGLVDDPAAAERLQQLAAAGAGGVGAGAAPKAVPAGRELSDEELSALLRRVSREKSPEALESQLAALSGADAVERLIAHLSGDEAELRLGAAVALGTLEDARAVGPLLAVVTAEPPQRVAIAFSPPADPARIAAARSLGRMKARGALADLQRLFAPTAGRQLLVALAQAIGEIDEAAAAATFSAAVFSEYRDLRDAAAEGLASIGEPAARESVARLLDDPAPVNKRSGLSVLMRQVERKKLDPARLPEGLADALAQGFGAEDTCNLVMASSLLVSLGLTEPFLAALGEQDLEVLAEHYPLYVMLAVPGSETLLAEALRESDSVDMYRIYKLSGNRSLLQAAGAWAGNSVHARDIEQARSLGCHVTWGETQPIFQLIVGSAR